MFQGSAVPNARYSNITDTSVNPSTWSSHPNIDRSNLSNCSLNGLSEATIIGRSCLTFTTINASTFPAPSASISGAKSGKSHFDRSNLDHAHVTDSYINRSTIKDATLNLAHLDRSTVTGVDCVIERSRLDRSNVDASRLMGESMAERSTVKQSEISGKSSVQRSQVSDSRITNATRAERSVFKYSHVEKSYLERSSVVECEVANCRLERTTFHGMRLENGRWERGNLVGRLGDGEVICEKIGSAEEKEKREQEEMDRLQAPMEPTSSTDGYPPDEKRMEPDVPQSLRIDIEHSSEISPAPDEKHEYRVKSPISEVGTASSGVGWSTGIADAENAIELENWDGPRTMTPPPPYDD